ncbi:PAS domain S-box protein [Rubrobacter marinus]|uniref:histidine kinase n=1 Tax=Rubrobacter marinus TaxID=2653852 RepID=A0A6G8PU55_9ACTN|nr:PAS domain S-box protein [Rubrobacter marinus]QIN77622.1 PAS domain S-box protein [Rubrobacter marinus]
MPEITSQRAMPTDENEAEPGVGFRFGASPDPTKNLLSRLRRVFLLFAVLMAVLAVPLILQANATPRLLQASAIAGLLLLISWWILGYRRERFPVAFSPLEGSVVFAVALATGVPPTALGLIYSSLMFRSLYGSLRSVVFLMLLYLAAFFGAVAAAFGFDYLDLPPTTALPEVLGLPLVAVMFHVLATTVAGRERAMSRERTLRESAAALVAALDREGVYGAALDGARALVRDVPGTRVCLAVGPPEKMTVSAAVGEGAEETEGAEVNLHDLPEPIRASLLGRRPSDVAHAGPGILPGVREALSFEPKTGSAYHVPLIVRDEFGGLLVVSSDAVLPRELKDSVNTLGSQIALALESISLTEELYRRRSEGRLHTLLQNTSDLLTVVDAEGSVLYESPSVERVLGYKPAHVTGADGFEHVHPDDLGLVRRALSDVTGEPGPTPTFEVRVRHSDGTWRTFESVGNNLLHDPDLRGIVINSRDVTERRNAEKKLTESEANLAEAQRIARLGSWEYEPGENRVSWSDEAYRIFGFAPQEFVPTFQDFFDRIHPDDRALIRENMARISRGEELRDGIRFRVVRPDGEVRLVQGHRHAEFDETGALIKMTGTMQDVTERNRAEEAMRASEAELRALFEAMNDLMVVFDGEGRCLKIAPTARSLLYRPPEEMLGKTFHELFPKEQADAFQQSVRRALEEREPNTLEYDLLIGDRQRWFEATFSPMLEDKVFAVARDITERKKSERALRESESSLAAAQRMARVGNWTIEVEEDEIRWSDEMFRIFGYAPQEFVVTYKRFVRMVHPDDRRLVQGSIREALYGDGRRHSLDYRLRRPDGEVRSLHSQYEAVLGEDGRALRLVGTSQDVTERRRAEEELRESEERYRAVIEQAGEGIFLFDPSTKRILEANLAFQRMFGYAAEELARMKVYDLIPEDPEGVDRNVARAVESGHLLVGEREYRRKDGTRIDVLVSGSVISYSGNQVVCSVIHDVTERKRAEEALQENHAILRGVAEGSTDAIFVKDGEGRYIMVNSACAELFGMPVEEVVGRRDGELFAPDAARRIAEDNRRILAAGETQTYEETLTFAGRRRTFLTTKGVRRDHRGKIAGIFGVARDITERKRAEELLQQRSAAIGASIDGIAVLDENATFTYVNDAFAEIYGYGDPERLVGKTWEALYSEEQIHWFQAHLGPTLRGEGHWRGEAVGKRRDGSSFPQEISVTTVAGSGFVCVVRDVTERKRIEEEIRRLNEDLEERVAERTAQLEAAVRESGRAAEALRGSEARLKQSNRELQDFAYVASHDLQEPLRKVRTFGDRLRTKYAAVLDDQGRDYLGRMQGSATRMQALIEDLLALSRITTMARPFAPVDLGEVAREVLSDLETRVERSGGRVEVGELPVVEADRAQMRQLFQNLIGNALKFHRPGEPPLVRVRASSPEEREAGEPGGEVYRILVEDNGIGLEEEHAERIFAPFERLHGRGSYEGTGMGLAICRRVVERHGGAISARSAPGRGTTFVVTLPAQQPEPTGNEDREQAGSDPLTR